MTAVVPVTACLFYCLFIYCFYLMVFSERRHYSFVLLLSESVIMYYTHVGKMNNQFDYSTDFLIHMWRLKLHRECTERNVLSIPFHCLWFSWHLYSWLLEILKCHCSFFFIDLRAENLLQISFCCSSQSCFCVLQYLWFKRTLHVFFGFFCRQYNSNSGAEWSGYEKRRACHLQAIRSKANSQL